MNPLDLPFNTKVELLHTTNSIPVGTGINFLHFLELDLTNIRQKTNSGTVNLVRAEGIDEETMTKFREHIENGKYTFTFQQPVVCKMHGEGVSPELYELICGEHRYQAHAAAGRKKMLVAVVEFDSLLDKIVFQSNENDPEDVYIKNPRTVEDVIVTLSGLVDEGVIDINDDKSINAILVRLNQKTNDFPDLRSKLKELHGITNPVIAFNDVKRAEWCSQHNPEIVFSSRSNVISVDKIAYLSKTFKGGSGTGSVRDLDYDPRCFFDVCHVLQQENVSSVKVISSVNKCPSRQIQKVRAYKREKMMQEWLDRCCSIVDDYRSGKIDPVKNTEFKFVPQINNVDDMECFA